MTEETKTPEPTKEDIAKLQAEIQAKESQTLEGVKQDVAAAVKKEIKQENELEAMKSQNEELNKRLDEQKKESEEQLKKLEESIAAKMQDLTDSQKSVKTNDSPFKPEGAAEESGIKYNDPEIQKGIEQESQKAFVEKYGLGPSFGSPL